MPTRSNGFNIEYQYNSDEIPDGIRHAQSDGTNTKDYFVDANRSYAQVLAEVVNGSTSVSYHHDDDLISQDRNNATHYFHVDGLGSTRVLTDEAGYSTDAYDYAAFGEVLNEEGSTDNDYLYTGEQFDAGLDRYYLRARYYDQGVGRFDRMDTWTGRGMDPITLNKYLYGNADPQNNIDPTGMFSLANFGTAQNIQSTLRTRSGVAGFRSAVNKAVGTSLKTGGKSLKQATTLLRQCIKKKDKCDLDFNLLIVGSDNEEMRDHIQWAQSRQMWRTMVLTYIKGEKGKSPSGWYRNKHECTMNKQPKTDCDEYPMRSTSQGGRGNYSMGMVSLRRVASGQNRSVGGHFGFLASQMDNKDKFVVVPSTTLPTVALPIGKGKGK